METAVGVIFWIALGIGALYLLVQILSWLVRLLGDLGQQAYYEILNPVYHVVKWVWLAPYHILRFLRVYVLFKWLGINTFKGTKFVGIKSYRISREGIRKTADFIEFQMEQGKKKYREKKGYKEHSDGRGDKEEFYRKKQEERQRQEQEDQKKQEQENKRKREQEQREGKYRKQQNSSGYKSPYEVLGVSPTSTKEEIKKAYKALVHKYHPDHVNHLGEEFKEIAHQKFLEINKAYDELMKR